MSKIISRQFLKAVSLLISAMLAFSAFVFAPVTSSAATYNNKTDFMNGRYGIFLHYLSNSNMTDEQWEKKVKSFDSEVFASAAETAGASWVTVTLTQADGRYCIPIETIFAESDIPGFGSGTVKAKGVAAEDDLVARLYTALSAKGIKLMLYWIPSAPSGNAELAAEMGATEMVSGNWSINETVYTNMSAAMRTVSEYYGDKISGWWIDGCYDSVDFTETVADGYKAALTAGNADAVVAFNNGAKADDCRFECEDYTAGEICHPDTLDITDIYDYSADSRWSPLGYQKHFLTFLGDNWGFPGTHYDTDALVKHCYDNILSRGAAISFDVACSSSGTIDAAQLAQLEALKEYSQNALFDMPLGFESGLNNIFGLEKIENNTVYKYATETAGGENALNGDYSLLIVPDGVQRTSAVSSRNIKGISGFSWDKLKNGTSEVDGIMLRMKITGSDASKPLAFSLFATQSGKSYTWLGRNAVLYDTDGNLLTAPSSSFSVTLPAEFDGFIFLPFTQAKTDGAGWPSFSADTDTSTFVDFSQNFNLSINFKSVYDGGENGWIGTEVLLDDIAVYSGDHYDMIRSLGYDLLAATQPEYYSFPLDFEGLELPAGWNSATATYIKVTDGNKSWPSENFSGYMSLVSGSEALNGKYSLKISVPELNISWTDEQNNQTLGNITTGYMPVDGIEELSFEKLADAAKNSKSDYAYIRIRMKLPESEDSSPFNFALRIKQDGITDQIYLAHGEFAYDLNGNEVTSVRSNTEQNNMSLPSGFDGYLYIPFTGMTNTEKYIGYSSATEEEMPDMSEPFSVWFFFANDTWCGADAYIDDMSIIMNNSALPFTFDNEIQRPFTLLTNSGASASGLSYVTGSESLNGNTSFKIDFPDNSQKIETNHAAVSGNAAFSWDSLKAGTETVSGIMMRIKITGGTAEESLPLTLILYQSGKSKTWLGRSDAVIYDLDGNKTELSDNKFCLYLPGNFDGYLFLPFSSARLDDATWTGYGPDTDMSAFVDISADYELSFMFGGVYDNHVSWAGTEAVIDDISYYGGSADEEHYAAIRALGYEMLRAEQPEHYTVPLDFENYELPFAKSVSYYSYNGGYPTINGSNRLVGTGSALSGKVSLALTVPGGGEGSYVRAETSWSEFAGISGLDKATLMLANSDYASLRLRIRIPDGSPEEMFTFNIAFVQDTATANSAETVGYLSAGACGYNADGSYNSSVTYFDRYIKAPAGFDGYIEIPLRSMFAVLPDRYLDYGDSENMLPDLSENFSIRLNFYDNTEGRTILIDDISVKKDGTFGDLNGDGAVNAQDSALLKKALWGAASYDGSLDLNGDGYVDVKDLIRLNKLLSMIS